MIRLHCLQHVPFEGLASIDGWANSRGHDINCTRLYQDDELPVLSELDWLIVMGGPMNINETTDYPWLEAEKRFIHECIKDGKVVLGICLGAQLIARVLGARITRNPHTEIGWYKIEKSHHIGDTFINEVLPDSMIAYHWHGDTFSIPEGAIPIASSEACVNQGFLYGDRVVGLQFHLETTWDSARALVENCAGDLRSDTYVQTKEEMLNDIAPFDEINKVMFALLDQLAQHTKA